ncbi:hypothetical protein T07_9598, partial [Trichinella nelsoni]
LDKHTIKTHIPHHNHHRHHLSTILSNARRNNLYKENTRTTANNNNNSIFFSIQPTNFRINCASSLITAPGIYLINKEKITNLLFIYIHI